MKNKWNHIKQRSFCIMKEAIIKMKTPNWREKTYACIHLIRGYYSRSTKKQTIQQEINPIKEGAKELNWYLLRRYIDGEQTLKNMLTITYQKNANQNCKVYHFTSVRMAHIKKNRNKCWWWKRNSDSGNVNLGIPCRK